MIHLAALPGAPRFEGSIDRVVERACQDASVLSSAGFPGVMIENFGDAPFFAEEVPSITVAAMTRVVAEVVRIGGFAIGVNVLRNDALAALAVAAATGAGMIRVNVLSGIMFTDQGPIIGRAAELARLRAIVGPDIAILADVFVKHATPSPGLSIAQAAIDTWERGGADALIVSGAATGSQIDLGDARRIRQVVAAAPLIAGSGATPETLPELASIVDSIIVGTALKEGGQVTGRVDPALAAGFVVAADSAGWI